MNIQWYPGHMAKASRELEEAIAKVDAVCELIDARIPVSSRNPRLAQLDKPRLIVLNRADLADPESVKPWLSFFKSAVATNGKTGAGIGEILPALRRLLADRLETFERRAQSGRRLRVMVAGIPNVGKSSVINRLAGRPSAKTEDRPGVTRTQQWVPLDGGFDLLDTPGLLWPKQDDERVGAMLALTGAIREEILDCETLGAYMLEILAARYPAALRERCKLESVPELSGAELLELAARKRGFLMSGGVADTERAAKTLLRELRSGLFGRVTLEWPE